MTDESARKVVCEECEWTGRISEVLRAQNPWDETDTILGCPKCRSPESFRFACDEPDCWASVTCGTPTPTGYRSTCGKHAP